MLPSHHSHQSFKVRHPAPGAPQASIIENVLTDLQAAGWQLDFIREFSMLQGFTNPEIGMAMFLDIGRRKCLLKPWICGQTEDVPVFVVGC